MRLHHTDAARIFSACRIDPGQDFYTLSAEQVDRLLVAADLIHYRKPRHANGSRGRYFHAHIQRAAARQDTTR